MSQENEPASKKLFVQSWGCQMNVYDSQRMTDLVLPTGYHLTENSAEADLIILNTCHIREKASEKLFSELGRLRKQQLRKRSGAPQQISVAGCVAQALGEEIIRRAPYVQVVVGPQTYHQLPELLARAQDERKSQIAIEMPAESKFDALPIEAPATRGASAFLSVQEGCDKFCTFCVVPYTRGAEVSRPASAIMAEARRLVEGGAREITLLGQNVNAWHGVDAAGDARSLAWLLHELAQSLPIERLRYTTSHPRDMSEDLIAAHGEIESLMPFLHLPVQSGSDAILKAMNRKHRADEYLEILEKLRRVRPDIALSSDFIVGFPGETDVDFEATLALVRQVKFAAAYSFKYSARPGTPAAAMSDPLPESEKDARLQILQALLREQQASFNQSLIGQTVPVLFDRAGQRAGQLLGRSPFNQPVHAEAPERLRGQIVPIIIESATATSLMGHVQIGQVVQMASQDPAAA